MSQHSCQGRPANWPEVAVVVVVVAAVEGSASTADPRGGPAARRPRLAAAPGSGLGLPFCKLLSQGIRPKLRICNVRVLPGFGGKTKSRDAPIDA